MQNIHTDPENTIYNTSEAPLEPDEWRKLKKGYYFIPIFTALFSIFFFFFYRMQDDVLFKNIIIGFILFFTAIMFSILRGFILDLWYGNKLIVRGLVTHKEIVTHSSSGNISNLKGSGSGSASGSIRSYHYLYFGSKKMQVPGDVYHKFKEGDFVEIHQSKRIYNITYKAEVLQSGVIPDKIAEVKKEILRM